MDIPGKGIMWKTTYEMLLQINKNNLQISSSALCDSLNENANGLFGKAMDNLKLIK